MPPALAQATPIEQGRTFYAPYFEIHLRGRPVDQAVVRDVLEVRYSDSLDRIASFEFTLHDWDPVQRVPRYSSPYDEAGALRRLDDGTEVPSFDPGAQVDLYVGYYPDPPVRLLTGQVVSLSPTFPASGAPTLTVRALSLLYTLQRAQAVMPFEDKRDSEIARAIGQALGIEVRIPAGQEQDEVPHPYVLVNNEYPILFLMGRARRLGYDIYVEVPDEGEPSLFFGRTEQSGTVYGLTWGRSLVQFTPEVKTKGQVAKVVVRGWNPLAEGDDRAITGEATIQDLDPSFPDPELLAAIDGALAETHEEVVDDPVETQAEADEKALGILRDLVNALVTGTGRTVGLPELRAGRTIYLDGLGVRFSGSYLVTESTHTLGAGGYTTEFTARMEVTS